jgi:phosphatidylglycerophosphate synthase
MTSAPTQMPPPLTSNEPVLVPDPDDITLYFGRMLSRHLTPGFLALGVSANGATAVWGVLGLANCYVIYRTLRGQFALIPVVFLLFYLALVVDCVDGEVARARKTASPIGGKLLDGLWHKLTEFGLLAAYSFGLVASAWSNWALPLGLMLMAGEGMNAYVYERRLLILRVHARSKESASGRTKDDSYSRGERWKDFSGARRRNAVLGLVQYKSAYFMIALAMVSVHALFGGVVLLSVYKHFDWIRLTLRTVNRPPQLVGD